LSQAFVGMIGGVALLVLLIASFNYTNTSIALAGTRIKEIALRKVMGSQRKHLIIQFLLEHVIISFIAVVLSAVFVNLITPFYMSLRGTPDFSSYKFIALFLLVVLIFTTLISGAYPAFYISKLKTADTLRRNLKLKNGNWFTYILLTLQMSLTVAGIGIGISFANNIDYIINVDKGYDMDQIITVYIGEANKGYAGYELYKSKIIENPDIQNVAPTIQHINWIMAIGDSVKYKNRPYMVTTLNIGVNYLQTMGVKLKLGRFFDGALYSDTNQAIVNEYFIKTANVKDPLNKSIIINNRPHRIIGVVKDYMQYGVTSPIDPVVITLKRNKADVMVVKVSKDKIEEVNRFLEKKWNETFEIPYGGYLQVSRLDWEMSIYKLMRSVFLSVSAISLLLSLVGLYILITLIINKKTKEIGVRKILGSPVGHIVFILSKNFLYMLGIATLTGSLVGLLVAKYCFDSIIETSIKLDVSKGAFIWSSLIIVVLTVCTISLKVFRAANANPIENLKYE
jgi:putative ABC transport system permease protein